MASRGHSRRLSLVFDHLEYLFAHRGVSHRVLAEVFGVSVRALQGRLYRSGVREVKELRDADVAEDYLFALIRDGVVGPEFAENLSEERQAYLRKHGLLTPDERGGQ